MIRGYGFIRTALAGLCLLLSACTQSAAIRLQADPSQVRMSGVRDALQSWHIPQAVPATQGARLLMDAPRPAAAPVALARSIMRANPRLDAMDALRLAIDANLSARRAQLDGTFFGATIRSTLSSSRMTWERMIGTTTTSIWRRLTATAPVMRHEVA